MCVCVCVCVHVGERSYDVPTYLDALETSLHCLTEDVSKGTEPVAERTHTQCGMKCTCTYTVLANSTDRVTVL